MKGFTLIELLVVMGVIVILIGIGIPAFRNYQPNLQLSGATRNLISDIRYVQQLAVAEQIGYGIKLIATTNEYQIIKYGVPEEVIKEKQLPSGISFLEIIGLDENQVIFNPYGAVRESGSITLTNIQNTTERIDIRPSGFVRIIK